VPTVIEHERPHHEAPAAASVRMPAAPAPIAVPLMERAATRVGKPEAALPAELTREPETDVPPPHVHYTELTTDHARVELEHPSLGRLQVEVQNAGNFFDVTLLTRSLGASIALRAAEAGLRSDLRAHARELRSYRVRTETSARAHDDPNEDEEENA
jgi:hypothetical protein